MHITNPYAQGGWRNLNAQFSDLHSQARRHDDAQAPTFGALPTSTIPEPSPTLLAFFFISENRDILNSSVIGTRSQKYFDIATSTYGGRELTKLTKPDGEPFAVVEWHSHPQIEILNVAAKQFTTHWMPLSCDNSTRVINIRGTRYSWVFNGGVVYVYPTGADSRSLLARVTRGQESMTLEMTVSAVQNGLLEAFVATTVLLHSGRNID